MKWNNFKNDTLYQLLMKKQNENRAMSIKIELAI